MSADQVHCTINYAYYTEHMLSDFVKGSGTLSISMCPWKRDVLGTFDHCPHPYTALWQKCLELCKDGKVSTKTRVSQHCALSLYILVISVPDPSYAI